MNFDQYKNELAYPSKKAFTTYNLYKAGKVVLLNVVDIDPLHARDGITVETIFDETMFKAALSSYYAEGNRLEAQFKVDLIEDLGLTGHPKADKVYSLAYQRGHSSGYSEIYNEAIDLAELVL